MNRVAQPTHVLPGRRRRRRSACRSSSRSAAHGARAGGGAAAARLLFYYVPCGINGTTLDDFGPTTTGAGYAHHARCSQPLAAAQERLHRSSPASRTRWPSPTARATTPRARARSSPARTRSSPRRRHHERHLGRSGRRARRSARTRACRRCSSASTAAAPPATATPATAAPTRATSRGRARPRRCRSSPTPTQVFDQIFAGFDPTATAAEQAQAAAPTRRACSTTCIADAQELCRQAGQDRQAEARRVPDRRARARAADRRSAAGATCDDARDEAGRSELGLPDARAGS